MQGGDVLIQQQLLREQGQAHLAHLRATLAASLGGPLLAALAINAFEQAKAEASAVGAKAELGDVQIPVQAVAHVALATADQILAGAGLLKPHK